MKMKIAKIHSTISRLWLVVQGLSDAQTKKLNIDPLLQHKQRPRYTILNAARSNQSNFFSIYTLNWLYLYCSSSFRFYQVQKSKVVKNLQLKQKIDLQHKQSPRYRFLKVTRFNFNSSIFLQKFNRLYEEIRKKYALF